MHGHMAERFVSTKTCLECLRLKRKTRRRYPEKAAIQNKLWRAANREKISEKRAIKYAENKSTLLASRKEWAKNNKEYLRAYQSQYRKSNSEQLNVKRREWMNRNRESVRAYHRKYRKDRESYDPSYKLGRLLRRRVSLALHGKVKPASAIKVLGVTTAVAAKHIERMFKTGMTWGNWGRKWHLDHILPLAGFDLTDPIQYATACHYLNLRPEWKAKNIRKGAKRELLL